MKTIKVKAVIITDGSDYLIHGASNETPQEMFKAITPLWSFNPQTEMVHYVELEVNVPELDI